MKRFSGNCEAFLNHSGNSFALKLYLTFLRRHYETDDYWMKQEKPYTIELENRGQYLYVLVGGEKLTPDISKLYWDEIAERCAALNISKIMIEKNFVESVSPPEMLEMGVYLGKILGGKKIAFLDKYKNENINELGKVIARNHGVIMRIFANKTDGEKWLIGN